MCGWSSSSGCWATCLRRNGFPLAPLLIAFILEPILESSFRQSLLISGGSLAIFVTHPISAIFLGVAFLGIIWMIISGLRNNKLAKSNGLANH
jgi:putative tricarboxylic transport membrane protein